LFIVEPLESFDTFTESADFLTVGEGGFVVKANKLGFRSHFDLIQFSHGS